MRIKYRYQYKEYKDFPIATEISESRERRKPLLRFSSCAFSCLLLPAFIGNLLILSPIAILLFFLSALSVLTTIYAFAYYDQHTEKIIKKHIQQTIAEKAEVAKHLKESKYLCKSIKHTGRFQSGKCMICFIHNPQLEICKIKNEMGTREIPICKECIEKFETNLNCN